MAAPGVPPAPPGVDPPEDLVATGPPQTGRGVKGQCVYWTCMSHPKPETVTRLGLRIPADFVTGEDFSNLLVQVHEECGITFRDVSGLELARQCRKPSHRCHKHGESIKPMKTSNFGIIFHIQLPVAKQESLKTYYVFTHLGRVVARVVVGYSK